MTVKSLGELFAAIPYMMVGPTSDRKDATTQNITGIAYRSDCVEPGDAFFCVRGLMHDGHDFAADALARGASLLVVQRPLDLDVPQVQVEDTRKALALASSALFGDPSAQLKILAITGTNGKTTTTFLIDWIIRYALSASGDCKADDKTGLIGTVETRIGRARLDSHHTTPESYDLQKLLRCMLDSGNEYVSMEVSSHSIALDRVAGVNFAVAAFTNLTQDHLDFHADMQEYFEVKARLFTSDLTRERVINIDSEYGRTLARLCVENNYPVVTTGYSEEADIRVLQSRFTTSRTNLRLSTPEGIVELSYPLIGAFNVENVLLATGIARILGIDYPTICTALMQAPQVPGRLESIDGRIQAEYREKMGSRATLPRVFVDYAHTPDSIEKALAAISGIKTARVGIVFGCGGDRDRGKRPLMAQAARAADFVVVTSDNPRSEDPLAIIDDILPGLSGYANLTVEPDRRKAIAKALATAGPDDIILIAGKGHEDYQLVGDQVLSFDDRLVAAEELDALFMRQQEAGCTAVCSDDNEVGESER